MGKMLDDIKSYAERTGATIINCDDPTKRTVGFQAMFVEGSDYAIVAEIMEEEPPCWEIPLTAMRASIGTPRHKVIETIFKDLRSRGQGKMIV